MRIFGLFLALFVLALAIFIGGDAPIFINIPSFILVFGGTCSILLFAGGTEPYGLFFKFLLGKSTDFDDEQVKNLSDFFLLGSRNALAWGIGGQIIGIVQMMSAITDPDSIGPGMAVSMLTLLYGIFLSEVIFIPLNKILSDKRKSLKIQPPTLTGLLLCLLCSTFVWAKFFLLLISYSTVDL